MANKEIKPRDNTFQREKNLVQYRTWTLWYLAFGSMVTSLILGEYIGKLLWVNPTCMLATQLGFLVLMYYSVDGALGQFLSISSSIEYTNEEVPKKIPPPPYAMKFAIFFLCCTVLYSIVSFPFVSSEMTKTNAVERFEASINSQMIRDSINKANAFTEMNNQAKQSKEAKKEAIREQVRLINAAVQSGTESWKADYRAAKRNPGHWFWTCKAGLSGCAKEYVAYRDRIIAATQEGDRIIAEASMMNKEVMTSLSSIISYKVASDSITLALKDFTIQKEKESQTKKGLINYILIFTTFLTGIGSFLWTTAIRDHRDKYGQQVPEPDAFALARFFAIPKRFCEGMYNAFGNLLMWPVNVLERNSFVKPLVIEENRLAGGSIYDRTVPKPLIETVEALPDPSPKPLPEVGKPLEALPKPLPKPLEGKTHALPLFSKALEVLLKVFCQQTVAKSVSVVKSVGSVAKTVAESVLPVETVLHRIANRKCGICEKDIRGKRPQAKWCSAACRMKGNHFNLR